MRKNIFICSKHFEKADRGNKKLKRNRVKEKPKVKIKKQLNLGQVQLEKINEGDFLTGSNYKKR